MKQEIIICGYVGFEADGYASAHPRSGIYGKLIQPMPPSCQCIGGDSYLVSSILHSFAMPIRLSGIIGDDESGKTILKHLEKQKFDTQHLIVQKKARTPQFCYYNSTVNGFIQTYLYDEIETEKLQIPFSDISRSRINSAVITAGNAHLRELAFVALHQHKIPIIWYLQGDVPAMLPQRIFEHVRRTTVLVLTVQDERHLCNTLGLSSIEQLIKEGPNTIIVAEYHKQSFNFRLYSLDNIATHYYSTHAEFGAQYYRKAIIGFVAGLSYAMHGDLQTEDMVQLGISFAEEYLYSEVKSDYKMSLNKIKKRFSQLTS